MNCTSQSFETAGMPTPVAQIRDISIDTIGNKMYTVGIQTLDGSGMLSLNTAYMYDGTTWTSMDTLYNVTYCSAFYNGELIIGGGFVDSAGVNQKYLSKWTGTKWVHFGDSINNTVLGMRIIGNDLYCMGHFTHIGNINVKGIAKWDGSTWSNVYNCPFTGIVDCTIYNGDLYVAGNFDSTEIDIIDIAVYKAGTWQKVGVTDYVKGGLGSISCMEIYKNELYIAGFIAKFEGNVGHGIQKWNGTNWSEAGTGVQDNTNGYSTWAPVYDLMVYQNKLYVGGAYWYSGNIYSRGFSTWDGNQWCAIDTTFTGSVKHAVFQDTLFASSATDTVAGIYVNNLAKFTDLAVDSCSIAFSIDENENSSILDIYPNPTNGNVTITLNKMLPDAGLSIINALGEVILKRDLSFLNEIELDISNFPNGIYFVQIANNQVRSTKKIILRK